MKIFKSLISKSKCLYLLIFERNEEGDIVDVFYEKKIEGVNSEGKIIKRIREKYKRIPNSSIEMYMVQKKYISTNYDLTQISRFFKNNGISPFKRKLLNQIEF